MNYVIIIMYAIKVSDFMKKLKFLLVFIFMFFGFYIDDVKAVTTCDYGIICKYSLSALKESVGGGYYMGGGYLYAVFQCEDTSATFSECSSFNITAVASKQDMSANSFLETGMNPGEKITLSSESDLLANNINDKKSYFSSNNKFSCPTLYYLGDGEGLRVNFQKFGLGAGGRMAWTADPLSGPKCMDAGEDVDKDALQDQATEDASHAHADDSTGKNDDKDNDDNIKVSVDTITAWALEQGYDVNSIGDPCTIISPRLKELLNIIFWAISIIGIILVVVMTALSFIKAIVGSDDEKFRDAFRHLLTRIIVVIVLLLLPMILSFIITLINDSASGEVTVGKDGNIFCDIAN